MKYTVIMVIQKSTINIDTMKAFFILFVIIAHTPLRYETYPIWFSQFWAILGTLGVGGFLSTSGFLYSNSKLTKQKVRKILIPWIFSSVLMYLLLLRFSNPTFSLSLTDWFLFFIGYKSYYYFMTIYTFISLSFRFIPKKHSVLYFFVTPISLLIVNFLNLNIIIFGYLNPFNWFTFFWFGNYLKANSRVLELLKEKNIYITSLIILILLFLIDLNFTNYFNPLNFFFELLLIISLMVNCNQYKFKALSLLGRNTGFIYMYHFLFIGLFVRLPLYNCNLCNLLLPILILIIFYSSIKFLLYLFKGSFPFIFEILNIKPERISNE